MQKQQQQKTGGNVAVDPVIGLAGLGPIGLAKTETAVPLTDEQRAALVAKGVPADKIPANGVKRSWRTEFAHEGDEIFTGLFDEETGDEITLTTDGKVSGYVYRDAPVTGGKVAKVPPSVKVAAFGEQKVLTLTEYQRSPHEVRKGGVKTGETTPRTPYYYGVVEFVRPGGNRWSLSVKVTPSADLTKWRIAATLTQ